MSTNKTQIDALRDKLGEAIQRQDLAWFKESVEQARSKGVLANIFSPLMVREAIINTSDEMLKIMLENGANANYLYKDGNTPLHLVILGPLEKVGELGMAQLLLDRGANILKMVQLLLGRGAKIEATSNSYTPLHLAALTGNTEVVKHLLDHRANINAQVRGGSTALHLAAFNLYGVNSVVDTIELLIASGAKVDSRDSDEKTPLHAVASSLENYHQVAIKSIEMLLKHEADINAKDRECSTPLHDAVWHGKLEVAKFLISKGANVNALDSDGKTPLDLARQKFKEVNAGDEEDKKVNVSEERYKELETLLSNHGAKANLTLASHQNGYCPFAIGERSVTKAPFIINNTVTPSLPLSLPSAPYSAISGNSGSFSDTTLSWSSFGFLAMLAVPFFVFAVVFRKMRAPQESQDVQPDVEMGEGLLDEKINSAAANLHEGIKKFGAYSDELPRSSLDNINASKKVESALSL